MQRLLEIIYEFAFITVRKASIQVLIRFQAGPAPRDAFRGRAPKSLLVPSPSEKCEDCAPKGSNRTGATGVHFGACPSKNTACSSPSMKKISFQDEKNE